MTQQCTDVASGKVNFRAFPLPPPPPPPPANVAREQLPMCYHPSIEYQLDNLPPPAAERADALFPGVVEGTMISRNGKRGKPLTGTRRGRLVAAMEAANVTVLSRSSQHRVLSGSSPLFGVQDIADAKASADVVLNMHSEGFSGGANLEVPFPRGKSKSESHLAPPSPLGPHLGPQQLAGPKPSPAIFLCCMLHV
jgi:hypothetical protein